MGTVIKRANNTDKVNATGKKSRSDSGPSRRSNQLSPELGWARFYQEPKF